VQRQQPLRAPPGHVGLERHAAAPEDVEGVGSAALAEDRLALVEVGDRGAPGQRRQVLGREVCEQAGVREQRLDRPDRHVGASLSAAASSVMSIPTGHQAMQRPQPTQPELPNWSCHVPSLCVSQCR
jgi:hypothetical protein